uniref:Uncharacterized protein n=1 Tax=Ananas comosus var. bracteatus TaxID=296719 RepID=A0A6V7Q3U2_ANACO|nr:unnamed protein product [Ananas comosus var. bracteatus]
MEYSSELSSYEAACRVDPELQSFDAALHRRTSEAITALASGVEVRALSLGSLREVTGCLLDMNQEVVRVILDCKEDIWRSPDLFALVEDYFDCSLRTLDFCSALEHSLHRARDSHLLVHVALQRFAQEHHQNPDAAADADADADPEAGRSRYAGTLEELRRFTAAGDPFTEEFFAAFHSVYVQQLSMLDRLQQHKRRLDKRIRTVRAWRRVSSIIFAATFAAVLICSVVAAAIAAPPSPPPSPPPPPSPSARWAAGSTPCSRTTRTCCAARRTCCARCRSAPTSPSRTWTASGSSSPAWRPIAAAGRSERREPSSCSGSFGTPIEFPETDETGWHQLRIKNHAVSETNNNARFAKVAKSSNPLESS